MKQRIEFLKDASKICFDVWEEVKKYPIKVYNKKDGSIVTNIDIALHKILKEKFYDLEGVAVYSEEDRKETKKYPSTHILIDPIDGTKGFRDGLEGQYVSLVSYVIDGQIEAAIMYDPSNSVAYWASPEKGAYIYWPETNIIGLLKANLNPRDVIVISCSDSIAEKELENYKTKKLHSAIKFIKPVTGEAFAYIREIPMNRWDFEAGICIAKEAGCIVTCTFSNTEKITRLLVINPHMEQCGFLEKERNRQ